MKIKRQLLLVWAQEIMIQHPSLMMTYICNKLLKGWGLRLWCLTPLSTIFQLYRSPQNSFSIEVVH